MLTQAQKKESLALVRMDDYKYDPWGTCMMHGFGIADVLNAYEGETPSEWEYRPAMSGPDTEEWPASEYADGYEDDSTRAERLEYAGNVLSRYARLLEHAGRNY